MSSRRRVLLLGSSGFLGGAVGRALTADGIELVRLTSRPTSAGISAGGTSVSHDLIGGADADLAAILSDVAPDVVVNCVGRLGGTRRELVSANTLVVARLLDAMRSASPTARLVTVGSAAEYGVVPVGRQVNEQAPARPVGDYGVTKLAATQLVVGAVAAGLLEAVVLRVFNPIGPGTPEASVLGRVAEQVRRAMASGSARVTTGPLGAFRDFVDVRDVAAAVRAATLSRDVTEPVVNIGSGTAQPIRDTVARLAAVARFEGVVEESDVTPARSAGVEWIAADTTLAGHQLGWAPRYSLEESLEGIWSP